MQDLFLIGEIAKLFDINVRTLRYYDEIGLIKPEYVNGETGYRYYGTKQFDRLNTIKYLRALDMPISRIQEFFENRDVEMMVEILGEHQKEIERRRRELDLISQKIAGRLAQIEDARHSRWEEVVEKRLPERRIAFLRKKIPVGDDLEYSIREVEQKHQLNSAIFLGKVGVSIAKEDLRQRRFDAFSSIFILLELNEKSGREAGELPGGDYVTVRFRGVHREAGHYYRKLFGYMDARGYCLAGDSVEITLIDSGMTNDVSKYVTEIQIPYVKKNESREEKR